MVRPFAVIGLSYSAALTAAFFMGGIPLWIPALLFFILASAAAAIPCIRKKVYPPVIMLSAATAFVTLMIFNAAFVSNTDILMENEAVVTGTVCELPYERNNRVYYKLETEKIDFPDCPQKTRILVSSPKALRIEPYDTVKAKIRFYSKVRDQRYPDIVKGIYLRGSLDAYSEIQITHNEQKPVYYYALMLRKLITDTIHDNFNGENAAFISALLIGDKSGITYDNYDTFKNAGISHIIVASGFHLAVITGFLSTIIMLIFRLRRNIASLFCIPLVIIYMAAAGFTASIMRAGIMMILCLLGDFLFRRADSLNSLGIAAFVICLLNPYSVCDAGFWLSFAAAAGIITLGDKLTEKVLEILKPKKKACGGKYELFYEANTGLIKSLICLFTVPISALVFTYPVTVIFFGFFAPYSLIANLLVSLAATVLLFMTFLLVIADISVIFGFLKLPLVLICKALSDYILKTADAVSYLPFAGIRSTGEYVPAVMLIVFGITAGYYIIKRDKKRRTLTVFVCSSLLFFTVGSTVDVLVKSGSTKLSVLDTGNGITAVMNGNGETALLHCGGSYEKIAVVSDYLEDLSFNDLSYMLIAGKDRQSSAFAENILKSTNVKTIQVYDEKNMYERLHSLIFSSDEVILSDSERHGINTFKCCGTDISVYKTENTDALSFTINDNKYVILCGDSDCLLLPECFLECDYLILCGRLSEPKRMKAENIIISDSPSLAQEDIESLEGEYKNLYYTAGCGNIGIRSYHGGKTEIRREKAWQS